MGSALGKEITVRKILHHLGLFPSDAALESKILAFFAQRTALALSHVSHLLFCTGCYEPRRSSRPTALLHPLTAFHPLSAQELQASVSAFLDLRPDGYAIHQKSKRLAILEFTIAMDSSEDLEDKRDAKNRARFACMHPTCVRVRACAYACE